MLTVCLIVPEWDPLMSFKISITFEERAGVSEENTCFAPSRSHLYWRRTVAPTAVANPGRKRPSAQWSQRVRPLNPFFSVSLQNDPTHIS